MTASTRRMDATQRSSPMRLASRTAMTAPMFILSLSHAASSCAPSSNISGVETPGAREEEVPGSSINVALSTGSSARTAGSTDASGAASVSKTEYACPPASVR